MSDNYEPGMDEERDPLPVYDLMKSDPEYHLAVTESFKVLEERIDDTGDNAESGALAIAERALELAQEGKSETSAVKQQVSLLELSVNELQKALDNFSGDEEAIAALNTAMNDLRSQHRALVFELTMKGYLESGGYDDVVLFQIESVADAVINNGTFYNNRVII